MIYFGHRNRNGGHGNFLTKFLRRERDHEQAYQLLIISDVQVCFHISIHILDIFLLISNDICFLACPITMLGAKEQPPLLDQPKESSSSAVLPDMSFALKPTIYKKGPHLPATNWLEPR